MWSWFAFKLQKTRVQGEELGNKTAATAAAKMRKQWLCNFLKLMLHRCYLIRWWRSLFAHKVEQLLYIRCWGSVSRHDQICSVVQREKWEGSNSSSFPLSWKNILARLYCTIHFHFDSWVITVNHRAPTIFFFFVFALNNVLITPDV